MESKERMSLQQMALLCNSYINIVHMFNDAMEAFSGKFYFPLCGLRRNRLLLLNVLRARQTGGHAPEQGTDRYYLRVLSQDGLQVLAIIYKALQYPSGPAV